MSNASISNVITVSVTADAPAVQADNPNVICLMTTDSSVIPTSERYRTYSTAADVASDFGSASPEADYANVIFGTSPNAIERGGKLVIGLYRDAEETVAATAGILESGELDADTVLSTLQLVSDGAIKFAVDGGTAAEYDSLDFRVATSMDDVAEIIGDAISGDADDCSIAWDDDSKTLTITSDTTGASSAIGLATVPSTGTDIGPVLKLSAGSGAAATDGAASDTLSAEDPDEALTAVKALISIKGVVFIGNAVTDSDVADLATWAQANKVFIYQVTDDALNLAASATNPYWLVKTGSKTYLRGLYSGAGNQQLAASYMARAHTANFAGENTASTMHLKRLNVPAESYSQTQIDGAATVGLEIYTTIKDQPVVLSSGANDFWDNVYNLQAFQEELTTALYNVLAGTSTKIPQTQSGVDTLLDACEKLSRQYVRAGVFAPGTWSVTVPFGDDESFQRNIEQNGFFWAAGDLADQSVADRQARKSPVIQGALKNAGAIHSAEVIVNVNL